MNAIQKRWVLTLGILILLTGCAASTRDQIYCSALTAVVSAADRERCEEFVKKVRAEREAEEREAEGIEDSAP